MAYSNSPLINYTKISPNKTKNRNHKIDTISIHCVVGQVTAQSLGNLFANPSIEASSNYGVDKDGKIGLYVEEKDRSWCTSSSSNDNRAITIEVASDTYHPYKVTDKAYNALIELLADICRRNNIKKLLWKADKSLIGQVSKQNMTVHRWFANKSCPGDYLYNLHGQIANEVNKKLAQNTAGNTPTTKQPVSNKIAVDGVWGKETTKKAQQVFKTPVDSIVSQQYKKFASANKGLLSSTFEWKDNPVGGSALIKAIQKKLKVSADGFIGPVTIKAMQKWLKTTVDGFVSEKSEMVEAFQQYLNKFT